MTALVLSSMALGAVVVSAASLIVWKLQRRA